MPEIELSVGGRRYRVGCRKGEEARLRTLGARLDAKAAEASAALGSVTEARLLLMAGLLLADDQGETKAEANEAELLRLAERLERLATA